jgi:hypothetical protein
MCLRLFASCLATCVFICRLVCSVFRLLHFISIVFISFDCFIIIMSSKGAPIKIIAGYYQGLSGWTDKIKGATKCYTYVILMLDEEKGTEKCTKVLSENYVLKAEMEDPKNAEEAMLMEYVNIDAHLTKFVRSAVFIL